ncbi:sensor histidine kinase [Brevundimonas vesicularis]|uniref:sensor histidine kinase PhyK n=1 Tax=Brevundimonas vesicularis TaxID=41276 RepID=UPI0038D4B60B
MTGGGRDLGRWFRRTNIHGIRFRLGLAMAAALLPILLFSAVQTQSGFQHQGEERRTDLQQAALRSASEARSQIDSTLVLLETLSPEADGFYCEPRLTALVGRIDSLQGLKRYNASGHLTCASQSSAVISDNPVTGTTVDHRPWFQRLRAGERVVVSRLDDLPETLLVAVRSERPLGGFEGAIIAEIPIASLQPSNDDPSLPPGSQTALINARGQILAATESQAFTFQSEAMPTALRLPRDENVSIFTASTAEGRRYDYAASRLVARDVYVVLGAPAQGVLSWARLNPIGSLLLPLGTWIVTFVSVMLLSERIVIRWLNYLERIAAIYTRGRFSVRPVQAEHAPAEIRNLARTLGTLGETISNRDRDLLDALDEKDALMREIHHRVKNNLQIISSLLSMQQRTVVDTAARAALGDTRQRITALALIYRTLYQSGDIRDADSQTFLNELVSQLVASESIRGPLVTSQVEADQIPIDPDRLAPVALWLVEALTNAQKHAFTGRGGHLVVRFRVMGDSSILEVQDDGPGLPEGEFTGVGRTLMDAFAKQLRGKAEIVAASGGGSVARLTFVTPRAPARPGQADD